MEGKSEWETWKKGRKGKRDVAGLKPREVGQGRLTQVD